MSDRIETLLPVKETFSEEYFLRGEETGRSNYSDYKWMPDQTIPMAWYIKRYMGIKDGESVYEFGAARGFLCKALRMAGVSAFGYDISEWAIQNCDPAVVDYMTNVFKVDPMSYDFVIAKDVMEHLSREQLVDVLPKLMSATRKAMLIIVPLTDQDGGPYLCPKDEKDPTHKIRWNLTTWLKFLESVDRRCVVGGSYYVPEIKQANVAYENSCGFFLLRRF